MELAAEAAMALTGKSMVWPVDPTLVTEEKEVPPEEQELQVALVLSC
jgi:hypothetical protein